jgi:hypothetical protein
MKKKNSLSANKKFSYGEGGIYQNPQRGHLSLRSSQASFEILTQVKGGRGRREREREKKKEENNIFGVELLLQPTRTTSRTDDK